MESTVRELSEIVEEIIDQDGQDRVHFLGHFDEYVDEIIDQQEGTEIQYISCDMDEIVEEIIDQDGQEGTEIQYSSWDMVEHTWDEHHSKIMRACLQFCYLFPQDYEFQKNDLILVWIAEELLSGPQNETPAYSELVDRGSLYFDEFEEMNIFLVSSLDHSTHLQRYKLNKSVFHLLQQQHDDAYFRVDDANSYALDNTLHSSIYDSSIDAITLEKLYHAKRLCTLLILHENGSKLDQVPREVFLKLPLISVLDLSGTNIKEVPSSIGKLKQLRYLNLSRTPIARLPESVCSLYQMRILKLKGCLKLVSLPNGMRRLVRLQYLDVDVAPLLVSMPSGFGDLTDLNHLPAFVVGKENGCCITELKEMVNLHGTLRILRLENVSSSKEAADATLDGKKHIVKLELQWTEFSDGIQFEVLQNLQPHTQIEELQIVGFAGIQFEVLQNLQPHTQIEELQIVGFAGLEFPSWIGDPQFSKLVKVTLHDCRKSKRLPPLGKLPFLKHLFISDMLAVQVIDTLFCGGLLGFRSLVIKETTQFEYSNMFLAFPSLENLTLNGMPALKKWIRIEKGDFRHLQKLSITCCHKLTSLPEVSLLVSLQQLEISLCTSLKSLPNKGLPISLQWLIIMECPLLKEWCLKEAKLKRGKLADIPNIWIDYLQISLNAEDDMQNTKVSDSGRNLTARQKVYETRTRENQMEEQLANHGKNKKQLIWKEMIFGKKSKGGNGNDGKDLSYGSSVEFSSNSISVSLTPQSEGEELRSSNLKSFSLAELNIATRNFRSDSLLGKGGFGSVFKGWIDEKTLTANKPGTGMVVAVKILNQEGFQGHGEWLEQVFYLGRFYHPNLVRLVGYCLEDERRLLVYEFMPRGSLETHIFRRFSPPLPWSLRMKVALGAAKGLAFLHNTEQHVVYPDFRSSKILLDSDYNAKLYDFILAMDKPTANIVGLGTYGYVAPECVTTGHRSVKSDVYSFGVVLLELLSGRRAIDKSRPSREHNTVEWARPYLSNERKFYLVLDSRLEGQYPKKGAFQAASIVLKCLSAKPSSRPTMDEVVKALEGLQTNNTLPTESGPSKELLSAKPSSRPMDVSFTMDELKTR